jgi:hypothetical protein
MTISLTSITKACTKLYLKMANNAHSGHYRWNSKIIGRNAEGVKLA